MRSPIIVKMYALFWIITALGALAWLAGQSMSANQTSSQRLGIGLAILIIGLPAIIIGSLSLVVLKAKTASSRRLAIIVIALIPSLLLIGRPLIGAIALLAMVTALYATKASPPISPRSR